MSVETIPTQQTNFATAVDRGFARVVSVATNLLTLDKRPVDWSIDAGAGKTIEIYFGPFLRNLSVTDADFIERSFMFESYYASLDTLGSPETADYYEYAKGNFCNELTIEFPLTDKATASWGFVGTDTDNPTQTQKSGTFIGPLKKEAVNTTSDFARLRIQETDETGLTSFVKSLTLTLNNNVTPEKVLGTLGAVFMNFGNFVVTGEMQVLFTNTQVVTAVRANRTVGMDFVVTNGDGGLGIDIPSMTLGDGNKEFTLNETVKLNLNGEAFEDVTLGTSIGVTHFPALPTVPIG